MIEDREDQVERNDRPVGSLVPLGDAIFLHRPHGKPHHGITDDVIKDFEDLSLSIIRNANGTRYRIPDDVTFVTYSNYKSPSLIERCYEAFGIHDFVVLGRDVARWNWGAKVTTVLDYLESGACPTPYVLCTDALDVIMVRDPATLLERFHAYSCDLLFCNTFVDYPQNKHCRDFETLTNYTYPFHCRLSAGAYLGEKDALARYLRELAEAYHKNEPWALFAGVFEDQLGWRYLHTKYHPKIQVDCRSLIFKRYDLFRDVEE